MILGKWNYETETYDAYEVPDEWNCKTYSDDMEETVNCPHCGLELQFGDTYTSREIQTTMGFGYGVCWKCYQQERQREMVRLELDE